MRRLANANSADAILAGQGAGLLHSSVGCEMTEPIIGIDEGSSGSCAANRNLRRSVDPASTQGPCIMGDKAYPMAVDTNPRCMHERPSRRTRRGLIGARLPKNGQCTLLKHVGVDIANGAGLRIVCGSHRLSPLLRG
jgi:hypothetical protein